VKINEQLLLGHERIRRFDVAYLLYVKNYKHDDGADV
jgi:hypothetical protein